MRRLELLVSQVRREAESEHPSTTDGISDFEIVQYFNDAQDHIYALILKEFPNIFVKEAFIDFVANQESYDIPTDAYLGTKIKSVEYLYSSDPLGYIKIPAQTIFNRNTLYSSAAPCFYIRTSKTLLINPIPSENKNNALRVMYQRSIRNLDIRRGVIASASKTGTTLNSITLDLTPLLSKDDGTVQAGTDTLNNIDYICIVDKDGDSILDAIPVKSYDYTTGVITIDTFVTSIAASSFVDQYVVTGDYASTHSELPPNCERYLRTWATFKLLRRNANELESTFQRQELAAIENSIIDSFKNADDDIYEIPLDEVWE